MNGIDLIINFNGDMAFITASKCLPLQQVCIPAGYKRFQSPASWKIRVLSHRPSEKRIFAEVLAYNTFPSDFTAYQNSESSDLHEIERIDFRSIDTNGLLGTIRGSKGGRVFTPSTETTPTRTDYRDNTTKTQEQVPISRVIKESFQVSIQEVHFKPGRVTFAQRIEQLDRSLEFEVVNENIKEEYDAVKNYFGNILHVKKFQFHVEVTVTAGEITKCAAVSPEISRIDQKIIEGMKFEFVRGMIGNTAMSDLDQSLFTLDELFDAVTNTKVKPHVFYNQEEQFFLDLLSITGTKHYQHLRFLSDKHEHSILKLRFAVKPFSFVFLIASARNYYFVWETLNTEEATYVWRADKNLTALKHEVNRIDQILNAIKMHGKSSYIRNADEGFRRIYHDYSEDIDGFAKWKNELEGILL